MYRLSKIFKYQFSLFHFQVEGELFIVPDASHEFTLMISDYCELCSLLPPISVELGLRTAELMKFFNSRICQLIIGKNVWLLNLSIVKKSAISSKIKIWRNITSMYLYQDIFLLSFRPMNYGLFGLGEARAISDILQSCYCFASNWVKMTQIITYCK